MTLYHGVVNPVLVVILGEDWLLLKSATCVVAVCSRLRGWPVQYGLA